MRFLKNGVKDMLSYTASVKAEGEAKGRAEGRAEGRIEGRLEGALQKGIQAYYNMRKRGISKEEALAIADIPADAIKDEE